MSLHASWSVSMMPGANKLLFIIQARMTSTRLPGKVMLPLCGKTTLEIMLDRLKRYRHQIIIATTDDGSEKPVEKLCERLNIRCYRGDTDNVLSRYYEAAAQFGAVSGDEIVRLTSDCPLIDAELLTNLIDYFRQGCYDFASLDIQHSFPIGLGAEIMTFDALKEAHDNASTAFETEHVTPYIYQTRRETFSIGLLEDSSNNAQFRLTLDEPADYEAISEIYRMLECRTDFSYTELINLMLQYPYLSKINKMVHQKNL